MDNLNWYKHKAEQHEIAMHAAEEIGDDDLYNKHQREYQNYQSKVEEYERTATS